MAPDPDRASTASRCREDTAAGSLGASVVLAVLLLGCSSGPGAPPGGSVPVSGSSSTSVGCDPLPAPTGKVVDVGPAQAAALPSIVAGAAPGTTIRLADGTYANVPRINILARGMTLRSASGNARIRISAVSGA